MNAEESREYLKEHLAPLPKGYYWSVRDTPSLALCRVGGKLVPDKEVLFNPRPYATKELLLEIVQASNQLAAELDVTASATLCDITGAYHFGGSLVKPKEDDTKLVWWKRAINWLWYA